MDIYEYISRSSKNGVAVTSLKDISTFTGMDIDSVRRHLSMLERDGILSRSRLIGPNNEIRATEFTLLISEQEYSSRVVRGIYCRQVQNRTGKPTNPQYRFLGYTSAFCRIRELCTEQEMDVELYMMACFHTFPASWCLKKFKTPYPPPYIIASKSKAEERYEGFIRWLESHADVEEEGDDEALERVMRSSKYICDTVGVKDASDAVSLLINGSVCFEYVLLHFKQEDVFTSLGTFDPVVPSTQRMKKAKSIYKRLKDGDSDVKHR